MSWGLRHRGWKFCVMVRQRGGVAFYLDTLHDTSVFFVFRGPNSRHFAEKASRVLERLRQIISEMRVPNQFDIVYQLFTMRQKCPSDFLTIYKHPIPFETLCAFQKDTRCAQHQIDGRNPQAQNPNKQRFLSTSCIFWHSMSRTTWQLNAIFAISQS